MNRNIMLEGHKRLFECDICSLNSSDYLAKYVLAEARRNINNVHSKICLCLEFFPTLPQMGLGYII